MEWFRFNWMHNPAAAALAGFYFLVAAAFIVASVWFGGAGDLWGVAACFSLGVIIGVGGAFWMWATD